MRIMRATRFRHISAICEPTTIVKSTSIHRLVTILSLFIWSCSAGASPRTEFLGMAAPDIIELVVLAGKANVGRQVPYIKQDGDVIKQSGRNHYLYRNGNKVGVIVGRQRTILRPFDTFTEEPFDIKWADDKANYWIESETDVHYRQRLNPVSVYRKGRPTGVARIDDWKFRAPVEHHLYLVLPHPLRIDAKYEISFASDQLAKMQFTYRPLKMRSEAVHVSQIGFHPDDPVKVAFLSCWMGGGGGLDYRDGLTFHILADETGAIVYSGKASLSKSTGEKNEDAYKRNFNLTDVYEMDFTSLKQPGRYRVYVDKIGCSYPFVIDKEVWDNAFRTSARGFYHQRSGIELGPPYTDFKRPRPFHPDDGVKVYISTTRLMDTRNGLSDTDPSNFRNLVAGKTGEVLPGVWGGYMDAGDWDRRIQHLISSLYLLDLAEQFPAHFKSLSLGIPESRNQLPDAMDEALFNLDFYRRLQTPAGGIRGGIESEEHPNLGETSWQESLAVMAYAPGSWSSFYYAGVAAKAAIVLKLLGQEELARTYEKSAIKAMEWAEADYAQRGQRGSSYTVNGVEIKRMDDNIDVRDKRNYAAAELFRLTGDPKWHQVFIETTMLNKPGVDLYVWQDHEQSQAAWAYVNTHRAGVDRQLQEFCRQAILKEARDRLRTQSRTAFRWTKNDWAPPTTSLTVSDAVSLVRAHRITGDEKYLRAVVLSCQAGLGANPLNLCYTTHLGQRWPRNPLHLDSRHTGQLPPEGITVFGPIDPTSNDTFMKPIIRPNCFPPPEKWPIMEAYWDVFWYPIMCEFTIHRPMAQNAYIWGYLAGMHAK
jgi:endoglucanase